ncbi:MAG: flippase-like domain-containing protein [Deltaproteobacteria bacterium]|nr:flippase-like domain-containing protein [Deltaproteobacteria bacterium]
MNRLPRGLRWLLSAAILAALYWSVPIAEVRAAVTGVSATALLAGLAASAATHASVVLRLRVLFAARGNAPRYGELLRLHLESLWYKLFLPGGVLANVVVRFAKLRAVERDASRLAPMVIVERWLATLGLAALGGLCWAIDRPSLPDSFAVFWLGALLAVTVTGVLLFAQPIARVALRITRAVFPAGFAERAERSFAALAELRALSAAAQLRLAVLAVLPHVFGTVAFAMLAAALGLTENVATWGWIRSGVILATMLPLSVAGLGVRDLTLVYVLGFYGVARADSLALASLVFAVTVVSPAVIGGVLEVARWLRRGKAS